MSFVRQTEQPRPENSTIRLMRMQVGDLDEVLNIEYGVYPFPWTHGNFVDSIQNGYETWIARTENGAMATKILLMMAVDEAHLLNITVAPAYQNKKQRQRLFDKAVELARTYGMHSL